MTVKPPAPPPLPDELDRLLRRLRLPYVGRAAPEVIATAIAQRWEYAEVLRARLAGEAARRDQATIRMRRRVSELPAGKTFDAWERDRCAVPPKTQRALRTREWIDRAEVVVICGPSDPCSHCPPRIRHWSNSPTVGCSTRIRRPFRRPLTTWTACSSPRWTLCKTVWRAHPSRFAARSSGR